MPDTPLSSEESTLLSADQHAERLVEAQRAQAEFKSRDSITSPGSRDKTATENLEDADKALDAALAQVQNDPEAQITNPTDPLAPPPKKPEEKEEQPKKPDENPPADDTGKAPSFTDLLANAKTKPQEKKEALQAEQPDPEAALPTNASQKTRETFENLKRESKERIQAAVKRAEEAELRATNAEKAAQEASSKVGQLTPELQQELKELREHRALFAREQDPEFNKKFSSRLESNYESIYRQLRRHQLPESEIDAVKKMSPDQRHQIIKEWQAKLDSGDQIAIELNLRENEKILQEREQELSIARATAEQTVKQLREAPAQQTKAFIDSVVKIIRPTYDSLEWMKPKNIASDTPPELRKQLEADNVFALSMQNALGNAIEKNDPETRAVAALAVPLSHFYYRAFQKAQAEAAALRDELSGIKKAGRTSRLSDRAPSRTGAPPKVDLTKDAGDTMDELFAEAGGKL